MYFSRSSCLPCRICSDASHTEGVRTRLGWVFFDNNVVTPLGYWHNIPASLLHDWRLTHPIMATAEALAVLAAIWQHRALLTGKNVIFFIDNEAAASAMIKGDSRLPVVGTMAMCVQLLLSNLVRVGGLQLKPGRWPQQRWCGRLLDIGSPLGIERIPRPSAARTILSRVC